VSPPSRDIPRKHVPEIRVLRHPVEKRLVKPGVLAFAEVARIWVGQKLDEASRVTETVGLAEPRIDIALPQDREQGVVLRQSPRQLNGVADEVRPRRAAAAGLWLIWVAQRHCAVVLERELSIPTRHPVRRRRPEADGAEGRRRFAQELLLRLELGSRREQRAIVPDAMHADLEASSGQLGGCPGRPRGEMDGIPKTLIEAMALGIPVLTTSLSGIPELVIDGCDGCGRQPGGSR
jgi:hypothetical protein